VTEEVSMPTQFDINADTNRGGIRRYSAYDHPSPSERKGLYEEHGPETKKSVEAVEREEFSKATWREMVVRGSRRAREG
jgi:D-Tyr-tRNAtyr deacylase